MQKVGTLGFTLKQQTYQLTAFVDLDTNDVNRLFVPFGDLTNNKDTYGGGRYIELDRTPTGLYDLDFNRAYHPFCVYNSSYDCHTQGASSETTTARSPSCCRPPGPTTTRSCACAWSSWPAPGCARASSAN